MSRVQHHKMTILDTASVSNDVELQGDIPAGIFLPAAMDGNLYLDVKNPLDGVYHQYETLTFAATSFVSLTGNGIQALHTVRLRSSVVQTADRTFLLATSEN